MSNIVVGKRHIPLAHVALVEPFDPSMHPGIKTEKAFKARIVLIDRQSVLTEETVEAFTQAHGFRFIAGDQVATNPGIRFGVENFMPAEGFEPTKAFLTRLSWRDLDGNTQSKLLLSRPADVLAVFLAGEARAAPPPESPNKRALARSTPGTNSFKRTGRQRPRGARQETLG